MSNCLKPDLNGFNDGRVRVRIRPLVVVGLLIIVLIMCETCESGGGAVNNDELYKLLGVSKKSTTKEIRVAFKKLALEKHPDKNKVN